MRAATATTGPGEAHPAIEALTLAADGTFSVRWPGGPRPGDLPHAAVPDYTGRYTAHLTGGGLEFVVEDPAALRDFSGRGTFRLDAGRLLLRGIWFGARARYRSSEPDVCEIAFDKK